MLLCKTFAADVGTFATATFKVIKDVTLWCGHIIKVLFTDYLFPAMKFVWPYIVSAVSFVGRMLITAPGLGTMGLVAGITASATCFALSKSSHLKGSHLQLQRWALQIAAIALAALGGAAFATGIALGIG